jgi:hypothetical protein
MPKRGRPLRRLGILTIGQFDPADPGPGGRGMTSLGRDCYARLFGEPSAALTDVEWIVQANDELPRNLSALNAGHCRIPF